MLTRIPNSRQLRALVAAAILLSSPVVLPAQTLDFGQFRLGESIGVSSRPEVTVSAALRKGQQPGTVRLDVKIALPPGANTYSQNPGKSKPTRILVEENGLEAVDPGFVPDHPPKRAYDENFQAEVEKYFGEVTFSRTYRLPAGSDPAALEVRGTVDLLVCDESACAPKKLEFTARWEGDRPTAAAPGPETSPGENDSPLETGYVMTPLRGTGEKARPDPLSLQFELSRGRAQQGETVVLAVTMSLAPGWQTYAMEPAPDQLETPTSIRFAKLDNLEPAGGPRPVPAPGRHETRIGSETRVSNVHSGRVTWLQEFRALADGPVGVGGTITYQICEQGACLSPKRVPFALGSAQIPSELTTAAPVTTSFLSPAASDPAAAAASFELQPEQKIDSLAVALPLAFLGGLILNVMPCVLPVIAIKILSFVQQAGEHRSRIFALNLAYTVGVVAVFLALATLAVVVNLGWGQQFQSTAFNVVMICIVFAMALSLLGVYEIPIPGLIPSAGSQQEGLAGAFTTGIVATILATPCTGPFMATVLSWAVQQPPTTVYLVFATMGLGMASPYVAAGVFPALVNWLPKPGAWMVTFKQFAGFVLLGTVIFLMYSLEGRHVTATLIVLLGIGLFLWMIGSLYQSTSPKAVKWRVRSVALASGAATAALGIYLGWFHTTELPWEPFTEQRMVELREEGTPMLIDFTADWCGICKTNEAIALNTRKTAAFVKEHGVVTMVADFTKENPEIRKWLNQFGQDSVPLTIIFPEGADRKLIALRGSYTQGTLLDALERAVRDEPADELQSPSMPLTTAAEAASFGGDD